MLSLENICGTSVGQILGCGTDVEIEMLLRIQHALSSNRGTQGCHCSFRPGHVNDGLTELADATKHCPCELAAIRSPQRPNQNMSKQTKTQQRRFDRDSIFANLNRSWMHLPFHVMPQCCNAMFVYFCYIVTVTRQWEMWESLCHFESFWHIFTVTLYHTPAHEEGLLLRSFRSCHEAIEDPQGCNLHVTSNREQIWTEGKFNL